MGNVNFLYDKQNEFGSITDNGDSAADFPNTMNMGAATAGRMAVDLKLPDGPVTTDGFTLTVTGCDDEDGSYENIVSSGVITEAMLNAGYGLPVPETRFHYLRASVDGGFVGTVQAVINSYLGK